MFHFYHTDFFSIDANAYAPKSLKRTCPASEPLMSLTLRNCIPSEISSESDEKRLEVAYYAK